MKRIVLIATLVIAALGSIWWGVLAFKKSPAFSAKSSQVEKVYMTVPKPKKDNESLPNREDLEGSGLGVSLSEDGSYQLTPDGEPEESYDVLITDEKENWKQYEQDLLHQINDTQVRLDEGDKNVIEEWKDMLMKAYSN
ncbi:hypothetical protein [Bdellovibrio bacteriovorus]|uniref:hypothetical protein n=1 Tax=Bdellovibrio TaxID=958 RepID=UPI0035A8C1E8